MSHSSTVPPSGGAMNTPCCSPSSPTSSSSYDQPGLVPRRLTTPRLGAFGQPGLGGRSIAQNAPPVVLSPFVVELSAGAVVELSSLVVVVAVLGPLLSAT